MCRGDPWGTGLVMMVREMFLVKEEGDTLNIRCQVCEMTLFGLKNFNNHINGKKHQAKFTSKVSSDGIFLLSEI